MTAIYRLKISLIQPHYPATKLHRVLEISGNASFYNLHERIFEAFDRWDEHAFLVFYHPPQKTPPIISDLGGDECGLVFR